MITTVTVYRVVCDRCGDALSPPRTLDHWESLTDMTVTLDERGWSHAGDQHWCPSCTCVLQGHLPRPHGRHCERCWVAIEHPATWV